VDTVFLSYFLIRHVVVLIDLCPLCTQKIDTVVYAKTRTEVSHK
jgi:hypothetical protein